MNFLLNLKKCIVSIFYKSNDLDNIELINNSHNLENIILKNTNSDIYRV